MAKLDTISFARLVSYVQSVTRFDFGTMHLETMHDLTETQPQVSDILPAHLLGQKIPTQNEIHESIKKIARMLAGGRKIEAIKEYRSLTGMGLKEAKDAIELFPVQSAPYVQSPYQDNY
jgi:ribosomal protein L7/L12